MSQLPTAVMLIIDQLPASLLGPYGNTVIETASFNRLAAQSLLFDFAIAPSLDVRTAYSVLWSDFATDAESILITDDPQVANHPLANFNRIILIDQPQIKKAASSAATAQLTNFFAQVSAWLGEELDAGQLCWIHSQGLAGAWDAPYELRLKFAGEDDPQPPEFVEFPALELDPQQLDPDVLLGFQQAAAAQVVLVDDCLGVLLDELDEAAKKIPLLLGCASLRGCGLGEHGFVGLDQQVHSESVHVPFFLRFPQSCPQSQQRMGRSSSLVSLSRAVPVLKAWMEQQNEELQRLLNQIDQLAPDKFTELVTLVNEQYEMIQTHAWKLIRWQNGEVQLYAKPDDRWEVNNVSDRCPLVVEKLVALLGRRVGLNSNTVNSSRLDEELVWRWD